MMTEPYCTDYPIITGRSDHPTLILRKFAKGNWVMFFLHESDELSHYNGVAMTAEEAIGLFIKHRINGEPCNEPFGIKRHVMTNI